MHFANILQYYMFPFIFSTSAFLHWFLLALTVEQVSNYASQETYSQFMRSAR